MRLTRRALVKVYAALYAAQLLASWSAYGIDLPRRLAACPSETAFVAQSQPDSAVAVSLSLLQISKTTRRRVRAPWERRLAVLAASRAFLPEVSTPRAISAFPDIPEPDRVPLEHPPA